MSRHTDDALPVGIGEHVVHRSTGVIDSHGLKGMLGFLALLPLYFVTFFVSFFPWSTRVPLALRRWWPARRRDVLGWYLLVQALVVFVAFSLVRTKLPHYTMPAFPCLALWLALQLRSEENSFAWFGKRFVAMAVLILALMLADLPRSQKIICSRKISGARCNRTSARKPGSAVSVTRNRAWSGNSAVSSRMWSTLGEVKQAKDFLTNAPPFILVLPTKDLAASLAGHKRTANCSFPAWTW